MNAPALSVVIPAYNEESRLPATLRRVVAFLGARPVSFEILVVDDGSGDATGDGARDLGDPRIAVLKNATNRGKGYSVRRGMLAARGSRRLITDADLSTPIEDIRRLEAPLDAGFDVAIGSRALPASRVEVRQAFARESMGRLFNLGVRLLRLGEFRDTQCGFKLFTASAASAAFSPCGLDGFCFDVEALAVARRRGLRIAEVGVTWRNDAATHVGLVQGGLAFLDLLRIRVNLSRGRYDPSSAPADARALRGGPGASGRDPAGELRAGSGSRRPGGAP